MRLPAGSDQLASQGALGLALGPELLVDEQWPLGPSPQGSTSSLSSLPGTRPSPGGLVAKLSLFHSGPTGDPATYPGLQPVYRESKDELRVAPWGVGSLLPGPSPGGKPLL